MLVSTLPPGDHIQRWRSANWPPKNMKQIAGLPIYVGVRDDVSEYALALGDVMMSVSGHIHDECRGKKPRWMAVPKVVMDVERLNLVKATAKASKRFVSVDELVKRCGKVSDVEAGQLQDWLRKHPSWDLVAHKECVDLRAYVFVAREDRPLRLRFYESGLVLCPRAADQIQVQDHRGTIRAKRNDAYSSPMAHTANGWTVYAGRHEQTTSSK